MRPTLPVLLALALAACGGDAPKAKLPQLSETLPNIVLPRYTSLVSYSGAEDALALLYRSATPRAEVEAFYRILLSREPWRLVGEATDNAGATVLHATQDGPPLWIRVWPDTALNATFIQMTGAVRKLQSPGVPGSSGPPTP